MKRLISLYLLSAVIVMLAACSAKPSDSTSQGGEGAPAASAGVPVEVDGGTFTRIDPGKLSQMLADKDFFFVNTHIPYEGEIEGTDAFIPYNETEQRLDQYPTNKSAKIVLYCRSGRMSTITAEELVRLGYTNILELNGGMIAWEKAGKELIQK